MALQNLRRKDRKKLHSRKRESERGPKASNAPSQERKGADQAFLEQDCHAKRRIRAERMSETSQAATRKHHTMASEKHEGQEKQSIRDGANSLPMEKKSKPKGNGNITGVTCVCISPSLTHQGI